MERFFRFIRYWVFVRFTLLVSLLESIGGKTYNEMIWPICGKEDGSGESLFLPISLILVVENYSQSSSSTLYSSPSPYPDLSEQQSTTS